MTARAPDLLIVNRLGQSIDIRESARVCKLVKAKDRECWDNCLQALARCYRDTSDARYVEGTALSKLGLTAEHGWLEVASIIVDPTPCWHTDLDNVPCYFAGPRFTLHDVSRVLHRKGKHNDGLPLAHRDGYWCDADYRRAYIEALACSLNKSPDEARRFLGWPE